MEIDGPVLSILGEKDAPVDWRKTAEPYKTTIGKNPRASLEIKTFPDENHNIKKCKTGGFREPGNMGGTGEYCDGYFASMTTWLKANQFGK